MRGQKDSLNMGDPFRVKGEQERSKCMCTVLSSLERHGGRGAFCSKAGGVAIMSPK